MRIVGGQFGGRLLKSPPGQVTRPTSDRVRESLFNILFHRFGIEPKKCADFFAGTGALGIESLSRGAEHCLFFEEDKKALKCLHQNLEGLGLSPSNYAVIETGEIFKWRGLLKEHKSLLPLDLIFSDPPYHKKWTHKLAQGVLDHEASQGFFSQNCIWVCEMADDESMPQLQYWDIKDTREFGETKVVFFERKRDLRI